MHAAEPGLTTQERAKLKDWILPGKELELTQEEKTWTKFHYRTKEMNQHSSEPRPSWNRCFLILNLDPPSDGLEDYKRNDSCPIEKSGGESTLIQSKSDGHLITISRWTLFDHSGPLKNLSGPLHEANERDERGCMF